MKKTRIPPERLRINLAEFEKVMCRALRSGREDSPRNRRKSTTNRS